MLEQSLQAVLWHSSRGSNPLFEHTMFMYGNGEQLLRHVNSLGEDVASLHATHVEGGLVERPQLSSLMIMKFSNNWLPVLLSSVYTHLVQINTQLT